MTPSTLRQLADIISAQVDVIEAKMKGQGLVYPDLDTPMEFPPSSSELATMSPDIMIHSSLVVSACGQLAASMKMPSLTMVDAFHGFHLPSCMRAALMMNITEILREAGPQGAHVDDIAKKVGRPVVSKNIARVLRVLATNHIYREIEPNVFTNNRISCLVDTGKSSAQLAHDPDEDKFSGVKGPGAGLAALAEHTLDEGFKASCYLANNISGRDPGIPLSKAFNTSEGYFEFLDQPQNLAMKIRFALAMEGTQSVEPPKAVLSGYNFDDLPKGSTIVDVGGGLGHITFDIISTFGDKFKYVVQDRSAVIDEATKYWKESEREKWRNSGIVKLEVHDFFTPNPTPKADVYLLRMICHDFPDEKATVILKQLREAAKPDTKLMILEQVVPFACVDTTEATTIKGYKPLSVPAPLLPNLGKGNTVVYWVDMLMHTLLFGKERTMKDFIELGKATGWEVQEMYDLPGSIFKQIIATPIS